MAMGGSGCACIGYEDKEICASALEADDPVQACGICCLQQGSMGISDMMRGGCAFSDSLEHPSAAHCVAARCSAYKNALAARVEPMSFM
jgi:hypothetical protein